MVSLVNILLYVAHVEDNNRISQKVGDKVL